MQIVAFAVFEDQQSALNAKEALNVSDRYLFSCQTSHKQSLPKEPYDSPLRCIGNKI